MSSKFVQIIHLVEMYTKGKMAAIVNVIYILPNHIKAIALGPIERV